ncbi:MAG: hypothetical protein AAGF12_34845, partial [Myxococcota bacterium]
EGPCPMLPIARHWCHFETLGALPPAAADLAGRAGLREERLTFSYLTLRRDTLRLEASAGATRVVSGLLPSKGKLEILGCDHRGLRRIRRLKRDRSESNEGFADLRRGDRIRFSTEELRIGAKDQVQVTTGLAHPLKKPG